MKMKKGFTIIELLVVVSIIALLIGILLPAIGKARDQARLTLSLTNLRNLGAAHGTYASEWNDRQFTLIDDNLASMGNTVTPAMYEYADRNGGNMMQYWHPPVILGWGWPDGNPNNPYSFYRYFQQPGEIGNHSLIQPIVFQSSNGIPYFGAFRLANCRQFNQYVSGRFYDRVFYAPKDSIVMNAVLGGGSGYNCFDDPAEYCDRPPLAGVGDIPVWTSYILSPASMFNSQVLSGTNGYTNPWSLPAGFRSPSMGQARYPGLKTHMLEHHWLQSRRAECNPAFSPGTYDDCEPYFFNSAWESNPATLFYDGHVETVGIRKAERADGRQYGQSGRWLWSRDTPFGSDGYFIDTAYDFANTSFHILTSDGILGRDITSD